MESPDIPTGKSPRRDLQGPRPAPLRVRKHSHKIRKPPAAPPQSQAPPVQHRPPVIIYTVSPKVIHVNPNEFMTLVQRLTGSSSLSSAASSIGAVSPAARLAAIERAELPEKKKKQSNRTGDMVVVEGVEISTEVDRSSPFPGILSPGPASLQPIPASFFSPPSDSFPPNFFHDLISPVMQGNRSYVEGNFMASPSTFVSPYTTYPPPSLDFFNNFYDL